MTNGIHQLRILKNHGNIIHICLFAQATLGLETIKNISDFEDWGLTLVVYKKMSVLSKLNVAMNRSRNFTWI